MSDKVQLVNSDILEHFNRLQKAGALDDLADLRKENRELEKIINDAAALISHTEIDQIFDSFISRILDRFIPQFLAFIIQPPRGQPLRQYCYRNLQPDTAVIPQLYYDILAGYFNDRSVPVLFTELADELGQDLFGTDFRELGPELIFPMQGIGGLYGIVILGAKVVGASYNELEKLYIDRMMRFLSISIQNGLHHESSITDAKTGLFTHDYFVKRIDEEYAHAQRHGVRSGLLMLDVDHFKNFNDSYGHLAGDEALVALAEVLKQKTRHEDCVARFGGEEFCILVSNCNEEGLFDIAERIRLAVLEIRIKCGAQSVGLSISLGGRMIEGRLGLSARILLDDADHALYKAKNRGRNRTELHTAGFLGMATLIRNARLGDLAHCS
ncbi:MAG: GGDEF domain-containing protein [Spirochaetes bacterium]|nr:GGDEF domain-containing protein [Spirochaetota bacterium]MBU0956280.1 GGDEF domain-containing protein [Spirochaetota bacterium]